MGVLDDILGGDKDDREERKENIDKIREKVQEGRSSPESSDRNSTPEPPIRPSELEEEVGMEPSGPQESPERQESPQRQGRREPSEQPPRREEPGTPLRGPGPERRESDRDGPEPEPEGPTHEDVPEPPEMKELDVPDIEKGPLFITVDKFRDALQAISDMRRVARDMEDYIGSMEGTLQEDRDTEEGIRDILAEAESDTEELQDIVSP
ncbi:MAG: hypothetical protein SVW02_03600 [Candidatus Nanohaloarchaea archaeon]|nr:hypothetical protein [Candidatus Nanohaloarchaea archaeon]